MTANQIPIDERAKDSMSVVPPDPDAKKTEAETETVETDEEKLEAGLEGSMDGSDPPSSTQP